MSFKIRAALSAVLLLCASAAWAAAAALLTITLPDGQTVAMGARDLAALPRQEVRATAHEQTHAYAGWDLLTVLEKAGVTPLRGLRGPQLRRVLRVEAADGYGVVYALAELDPEIGARRVLLIDRQDGAALPPEDGPLRLVAPDEKRPARWARQVVKIVLEDLR